MGRTAGTTRRDARNEAAPLGETLVSGGKPLWYHRSGSGGPPVVFLPGAGCVGLDYLNVHDRVATFTTSVSYDRAGTGWSAKVELPRSATDVTDELRGLLQTAGVPAPYVLAGHSLGGAYARRYAQRFPDEVAGLVFLDPYAEGYATHQPRRTAGVLLWQAFAIARLLPRIKPFYRRLFEAMLAQWPEPVRESLVRYHLRSIRTGLAEAKGESDLRAELVRGGDMRTVPMIVLASLGIDRFQTALMPESYLRELNTRKDEIYAPLVASVKGAEYRTLPGAGHATVHTDRPDAVVQAIRDVVDRAVRRS